MARGETVFTGALRELRLSGRARRAGSTVRRAAPHPTQEVRGVPKVDTAAGSGISVSLSNAEASRRRGGRRGVASCRSR